MEGQHGQQQQQQTQQEQQQTQQTGIFQRELLGTQQQHRQPVGSQREEPPQSAQQQQTNQQQQQHKDGQVAHRSERSPSLSDLPPKFTLFHEPATLGLRFTNALARTGFPVIAPILKISELAEGSIDTIAATFTPDGMTLPYKSASVHLGPLRVKLQSSPALNKLILALRGMPQSLIASRSEALSWLAGQERGKREPELGLEAWMSGMHLRMERSGVIEQRRLDLLVGPMGSLPDPTPVGAGQPARGDDEVVTEGRGVQEEGQGCTEGVGEEHGSTAAVGERKASGGAAPRDEEGSTQRGRVVHLVLWGAIDPETDEVSMTLGIAGSTVQQLLGLKALPKGYCLPLSLRGTANAPVLELRDLSQRLARIAVLRMADHGRSEGEEEELHGSATGKELQPQEDIEDTEPSMPKRGTKQRIKNVLGGALRAAVRLMVPGKAGLEQVEQQVAAEAAQVPAQECDVPWLRGSDEKARPL
mmetsp:Transcript_18019/g.50365  ORF Transcript_18019/g.50365 Transcript_18019/m.50365 type:complete len:474 (+) Transcript_18019:2-1423(+)